MARTGVGSCGRRRVGFTLVEILIVVVILGILAAIVTPQFANATTEAQQGAFVGELKLFEDAAYIYHAKTGLYPDDASSGELPEAFEGLVDRDQWEGGTPIGGQWDAENGTFGFRSSVGVHFNSGPARESDFMQLIDASFDDGDLESGVFRQIASDRYYLIVAF